MAERYRPGTTVKVLNFTNASRSNIGWNPFQTSTLITQNQEGAALEDSLTFCETFEGHEQDSRFWNENVSRFITALRLTLEEMEGRALPGAIHELSESARSELLNLFKDKEHIKFVHGVCDFLLGDNRGQNAETVMAMAQGYLKLFCDNDIKAVTSCESFSFVDLFERPEILVLEVPQHCGYKYRPILNMFFSALFRDISLYVQGRPGASLSRPLSIYLDDFAACLGRIPGISQFLNTSRSRNVRVTACLQEIRQLNQFYQEAEASSILNAFCTKIFTSDISMTDAYYASSLSGSTTINRVCRHQTAKRLVRGKEFYVEMSCEPIERALLTTSDIQNPPNHFAFGPASTFFVPGCPPFQAWTSPAYDYPELGALIRLARRENCMIDKNVKEAGEFAYQQYMANLRNHFCLQTIEISVEELREIISWNEANDSAKKWWNSFEEENAENPEFLRRVTKELADRHATINEFFLAYVYSNTDNIQANLYYLDYNRLKREEEKAKEERVKQNENNEKESVAEYENCPLFSNETNRKENGEDSDAV